jgi:hypothetical protein
MAVTKNGKQLPLVSPEEAIQWLLDTGLFRAKRWEHALEEWDILTPAQRTAAVTMSLAERNSLRETAGIARRTGYHPREQLNRLSQLVYSAVTKGLDASGLETPENKASLTIFWDVLITTFERAERELSGPLPKDNDFDDVIDGKVSGDGTRFGEYEDWSKPELREELRERGLSPTGGRRVMTKKLLRDDARPEDPAPLKHTRETIQDSIVSDRGYDSVGRRRRIKELESEPDEPDEPDEPRGR